jgi:methyltransferase
MMLFLALVTLTGVTRLIEMSISFQHRKRLLHKGATLAADPGFVGMVLLHIGILAGSLLEVVLLKRSSPLWVAIPSACAVLGASALRIWAIRSLGEHWNVRIINSTSLGVIECGPYKYIRHPNYVAVFLELAFLPLVNGAWVITVIGTVAHLLVLRRRIISEERILMRSSDYQMKMAAKPRFVPDIFRTTTHTYRAGHS